MYSLQLCSNARWRFHHQLLSGGVQFYIRTKTPLQFHTGEEKLSQSSLRQDESATYFHRSANFLKEYAQLFISSEYGLTVWDADAGVISIFRMGDFTLAQSLGE